MISQYETTFQNSAVIKLSSHKPGLDDKNNKVAEASCNLREDQHHQVQEHCSSVEQHNRQAEESLIPSEGNYIVTVISARVFHTCTTRANC